MIGRIYTANHQVFDLPELLSWRLVHTGSVPCDSFSVKFLYRADMAKTLHQAAGFSAMENGKIVLRGIVDEYTAHLGPEGMVGTIRGRGYAARLLDNESRPLTYQAATLAEIVRSHVTPYGIKVGELAHLRADSVYTVPCGASQWKALEGFCQAYGGFSPRFSRDGHLLAAPERFRGTELLVGEETPLRACTLREDHYGVLSEVLVIDKKQQLSYPVQDQTRIALGRQCRRVLYTPGQSSWAAMRYTGEYQLQRSGEEERLLHLELPGNFFAFPGDRIRLDLKQMGLSGVWRVQETENRCSAEEGKVQTLTLKETR